MSEGKTLMQLVPAETRVIAESLDGIARAITLLATACSPNTPGQQDDESISSRLEDLNNTLIRYFMKDKI